MRRDFRGARTLASLNHPGIAVLNSFEENLLLFLLAPLVAMWLVEGHDLLRGGKDDGLFPESAVRMPEAARAVIDRVMFVQRIDVVNDVVLAR